MSKFGNVVKGLTRTGFLAVGGILLNRNRELLLIVNQHFDKYNNTKIESVIPSVSVKEILGTNFDVSLAEVDVADGNVSSMELIFIAALVKQTKPQHTFEIGTYDGRTTLNIALNLQSGGIVDTLDLPAQDVSKTKMKIESWETKYIVKESSGNRFQNTEAAANINQLWGDSATFDFADRAGKIDLMFVDGSHSYEYVKTDSETALQIVKPGGIILWHDYNSVHWPGVSKALNELFAERREFKGMRNIEGTTICMLRRP